MREPWGWAGRIVMMVLTVVSVPAWCVAAWWLAWFWPGVLHGQTCDLVHQPWCTPGRGLPQYFVVATFLIASSVLLLVWARVRRTRSRWVPLLLVLSLSSAVTAGSSALLTANGLGGGWPEWWFA